MCPFLSDKLLTSRERGRDQVATKMRKAKQHFHQDLIGPNCGNRYAEALPVVKAMHAGTIYLTWHCDQLERCRICENEMPPMSIDSVVVRVELVCEAQFGFRFRNF